MEKKQKTGKNQGIVGKGKPPKDKQFKPGESGNPNGRPKGRKNFSTLFDEAIRKIVEEKKINITDPEREMVIKAVVQALKGDYSFYRDIMDRKYGKPTQPIGNPEGEEFKIKWQK